MRRAALHGPLLLVLLHVLLAPGGPARAGTEEPAAAPAATPLAGVKAEVRTPAGAWEAVVEVPVPGQWRMLLRGADAQCEARVFPLSTVEDERAVLMQAADRATRLFRGDGFGLPSLRTFRLEGRVVAESDWWVTRGATRYDGRIRLLRASPAAWALAWGLAPESAPAGLKDAVHGFARTLVPTEPAFFDPVPLPPDGEQVLSQPPGEEPLRRRHLLAALEVLEAGGGFRLPRAERAPVLDVLLTEAQKSASARQGFREMAAKLSEARGAPAAEQQALRQGLGQRLLDGLKQRAEEGVVTAQALALRITLGRRPAVGSAEDGLTRFEAGTWLDAVAFLTSLAADQAVPPDLAAREAAEAALRGRWESLTAEERAHLRAVARAGADLAARWESADELRRLGLRRDLVEGLREAPPGTPPPSDPLRALRARLDLQPPDVAALFARVAALPPQDLVRRVALLDAPPR